MYKTALNTVTDQHGEGAWCPGAFFSSFWPWKPFLFKKICCFICVVGWGQGGGDTYPTKAEMKIK